LHPNAPASTFAHIFVEPPADVLVTAYVTGPGPSLMNVNVRTVPLLSLAASRARSVKVIVAGELGPSFGVGAGGPLGPWLPPGVWHAEPEGQAEASVGACDPSLMALESGLEAGPDDPSLWMNINAPAVPSSTAHTMPNTIERFFQILSSTRAPPVRSSDLSSPDVRTIPPAGLSREP
jgi:hypothetical protein